MWFMWKIKKTTASLHRVAVLLGVSVLTFTGLVGCKSEKTKSDKAMLYVPEKGTSTATGSAIATGSALATGSSVQVGEDEYKLEVARKKNYQDRFVDTAKMEYTAVESVYIDDEGAVLDHMKVKKGDHVEKGDVLAVYHVEISKAKLEKDRILTEQARSNYEVGLKSLENQLSLLQKAYKGLKNTAEGKQKALEIKQLQQQIKTYRLGEKEVKEQEKAYRQKLARRHKTNLYAKKSGTVVATAKSSEGDRIEASKEVVRMRKGDRWLLKVPDPEGKLRYNMKVNICFGSSIRRAKKVCTGRVKTASDLTGVETTDDSGESEVYIKVKKSDRERLDFEDQTIYIKAVSYELRDVILVREEAINSESTDYSNRYFVYKWRDGSIHKRYVVTNFHNEQGYVIEQGVEEGDQLVLTMG